jgi:alpha-L-fucosidase 2
MQTRNRVVSRHFWRTGDWVPDQDHAGVIVNALQSMLMLTYDDTIGLLPAWPKDWNVDFKLHAPRQTTSKVAL